MRSSVGIPIPRAVTPKMVVTAQWANQVRESLIRLSSMLGARETAGFYDTLPPLWPVLRRISGDPVTYKVSITKGTVIERVTTDANAVSINGITNTGNDVDGFPYELDISEGDSIWVSVPVTSAGAVGTCEILIDATHTSSVHYVPVVGSDGYGSSGTYYYKLASLLEVDDDWQLVMFMAGDNIDHFRDLPSFIKAGGDHDICKEYVASDGQYKTKGLTGEYDGVVIEDMGDYLKFKVGIPDFDGADINLTIRQWTYASGSSPDLNDNGVVETLYFRKGICIGNVDPVDGLGTDVEVSRIVTGT